MRWLATAIVVIVEVVGVRTAPRAGLGGDHLGILLALVGFAVGVLSMLFVMRCGTALLVGQLVLIVVSSLALFWMQPNGAGVLGVFIAVSTAALRLRGPFARTIAGGTFVALAAVGLLTGGKSASSLALSEIGVIAFYTVALLARRLGEGQAEARRLLAEVEANRDAQADAAALAERGRLAREMHDVLAHSLAGLVVQLEGARLLALQKGADPGVVAVVERSHHLAKAGLDEAKRAIGMLRGDELPGPERLEGLARDFEHDTGTPCTIAVSGAERALDPDARLAVYRVAQEALTNVRKHAAPARVELELAYERAGTRLTVEDFGALGARAANGAAPGYGLTGMRERAELLGGTLTTGATAAGFRVELWVPAGEP
jgi:signal transduction histidine kinase